MKRTILVVDDDCMVLFIHEAVIEGSILTADTKYFLSAGAAMEFIASEADIDMRFLIFLDINMPVVDGWQMLDQLLNYQKRKNIFVVIVSSSIDQMDLERAFSYDMVVDYVVKPLKEEYFEVLQRNSKLSIFFE